MPRSYTTTELLASGRQKAFLANAQRDYDDTSWLRLLNEQVTSYLLGALVVKRRTNYLVESVDLSVQPGSQPAQFAIPSQAVGGMVRSLVMVVAGIPYALEEKDLPDAVASDLIPFSSQFPTGNFFLGAFIRLWPTQAITGILRIHYYRRPSVVVKENACVQISGFPSGAPSGSYRVSFTGTLPTGYVAGAAVDVVSNIPNFYRWQTNAPITAQAGQNIDIPFPTTGPYTGIQPAPLAVGDWVCLYDTAPLVTDCPSEALESLLWSCVEELFTGKGPQSSWARAKEARIKAEEDAGPLITRRNYGAMLKVSAFPESNIYPWGWG